MSFDPQVLEIIAKIDPTIKTQEIAIKDKAEFCFKEDDNLQNFINKKLNGLQFSIAHKKRDEVVEKLQNGLSNKYLVYFSEQNFGLEDDVVKILETNDKFDALRLEGCNGVNYDVYTEDVINHLQELEKKHPFILTGVGFDFVQGTFLKELTNVEQLAEDMYAFCPDIVEQGTGDIETLIKELKASNSFFYWWD